jgi:TetR/AcrR family transcriptional regulator, tetracycline repressor protein
MPLQRKTVADAALHIVDEVGLDGLTMRRLAAYLDIQNQSLYWHFTNKQELLNCMAELMIADAFAELRSPRPGQDWADWLAAFARRFRRGLLSHRDGARILAEADLSFNSFVVGLEFALDVLLTAGLAGSTAIAGMIAIVQYVLGNVFESQADPSALKPAEDEIHPHAVRLTVDEKRFPRIATLLPNTDVFSPSAVEVRFEAGLGVILDGLRCNLEQEGPSSTSR